jgi:hypothetical protein
MDFESSLIPRPAATIRAVQLMNLRRRVSSHSAQIKLMAVHGVLGENGVVRRRRAKLVAQPAAGAFGVQ